MHDKHVVIVGAGLVGAFNAILLAKRNFKVSVYEKRQDIRRVPPIKGQRTANLALSCRGMEALRHVGLEREITPYQVPMFSRMVHKEDGTLHPLNYGRKDQFILSTQRNKLNEILLNAAENLPNVTCYFEHTLKNCNLQQGDLEFLHNEKKVHVHADLVLGNDGAHSTIRRQMMEFTMMDIQQFYVPYGYIELEVAKTKDNNFAMDPKYLHLWPREEFLMLCTANWDRTFNILLFMTFDAFANLQTETDAVQLFNQHFPDVLPFVGEENLRKSFPFWRPCPMITIKCLPYHVGDKALIMGDASHAMLPFLAQGVNSGFEDCMILNDILDQHSDDFATALPEYTKRRHKDAHAVCDLTMYNFLEMRSLVNKRSFLIRKKLDNFMHGILPNTWTPLYSMVAFTNTGYHVCYERKKQQDWILSCILFFCTALLLGLFILMAYHFFVAVNSASCGN
ncbi:kynurenine 3-monooxygenase-like [Saccostrea echinata]|uniref:kynurenine 3-monooxygenase-like n=1 Tax=Saccostrea echinata TaxID=191078 RepID=UPI002A807CCA|nr:kynurenine 3-monooxygenase-like [Saccostrea echinata]